MPAIPIRNAQGKVIAHDDLLITNDGSVIRHINPNYHTVNDENLGRRRIASNAFSATNRDPDHGVSCNLGQLLAEARKPMNYNVPAGFGAVHVEVGRVRQLGLKVGSDPEPGNEFHGQIWGVKNSMRQKVLDLVVDWVVPIPGVSIR